MKTTGTFMSVLSLALLAARAAASATSTSTDIDAQPSLSHDGLTLIFTSVRAGGLGQQDLWMSTRSPSN